MRQIRVLTFDCRATKRAPRDEAVEIGRLMMVDKAGWLDGDIEIQVNIRSALEWRPEDWE